jgi:predicted Ser/Thr protein kinase
MSGMIGRTLKHYTVEGLLGKGGMGTVYRARDTRLNRPVALKVLGSGLVADDDRRRRFFQEARSAAAINHPAIAQVYDVDEADGEIFIAMEFVEGNTVRKLIADRELDILASLEIGIQVAEGLAKAHESGIVHRDIKSENIMVTRDGHAKILDFGLAKLNPLRSNEPADGASPEDHMSQMATIAQMSVAQTQTGMVVGTVAYMSPEQARGKQLDFRSDIFSLGVTLYEMATGQLPFRGDSPLDTMHAIAFEETRPLTSIKQNLPPDLQRIVNRCLRKRPEDRYDDCRTLASDLKALRKNIDSGVTHSIGFGGRLREQWESVKGLGGSHWGWAAGAGALGLAGLIALFVFRRDEFWSLFLLGLAGFWAYRFVRNRPQRMLRALVKRVSRYPEVRLIQCQERGITVLVDRMQAKLYMRINGAVEAMNRKLYWGKPFTLSIRDDVQSDECRKILQQSGVNYVREDLFS